MKDRIKELRNAVGLTQTEFATRIGISRSALTKLEAGTSEPAGPTIKLMVREFGVNEEWLREGTGEMFASRSLDDEIALFAGKVLKLPDDDPRVRIMRMLAQLPQEDWHAVTDMLDILDEQKKSAGDAAEGDKED